MSVKYDVIGIDYNATRKADPLLAQNLIRLLNPKGEGPYLDIGCGTGNYTDMLQRSGLNCIGLDPSIEMLAKAKMTNGNIDWRIGTAENTSLPDTSMAGIVATLTIHHWHDLSAAFKELLRVMKPKGRMVIFTSTPEQMAGYWLNHYFPEMLKRSMEQMPGLSQISEALSEAGFSITSTESYSIHDGLIDCFLFCGKHKPEMYLDERIQKGISSFSSLAYKEEVDKGLINLQKDIESGAIESVMASYANNHGDYLYIIAEKLSE